MLGESVIFIDESETRNLRVGQFEPVNRAPSILRQMISSAFFQWRFAARVRIEAIDGNHEPDSFVRAIFNFDPIGLAHTSKDDLLIVRLDGRQGIIRRIDEPQRIGLSRTTQQQKRPTAEKYKSLHAGKITPQRG